MPSMLTVSDVRSLARFHDPRQQSRSWTILPRPRHSAERRASRCQATAGSHAILLGHLVEATDFLVSVGIVT